MSTATPTHPSPLVEMAFGAMAAKIVCAAAELGIPERLADGPVASAELAARAGCDAASLRRLMCALAGLGVVAQHDGDRFALTDLGNRLRPGAPDSNHALVTMLCGTEDWRSWDELAAAVRSGERAWDRAHGMPVFDYYARHPGASARFNAAMAEHTREAAPALVARADLSRFETVMDVGGGDGTLMAAILRAHPRLEGAVFDVSAGLDSAGATLAAAGVAERCRLVAGDVFASVPPGADAYVLKQVLHDWDDERAGAILRACRAAMGPGARLLVLERTAPELAGPGDAPTLVLDILMLVVTGGRERTEAEFRDLLEAAALAPVSFSEPLAPFGYRVIEAEAV
jgi:O-methyltransferase domain/Dimerisation domain